MFLEINPQIVPNNDLLYCGTYELSFTIETPLNLFDNICFSYQLVIIDGLTKLKINQLTNIKPAINIILPLQTNNDYTLFIQRRLDYLSKDTTYFDIFNTIMKSEYMINRYMFKMSVYLKKNKLDDVYEKLIQNNVLYLPLKDIITYTLMSTPNIDNKLKINNIKNKNTEMYSLTKEYKVKPFNYQLENIKWCKDLESNANITNSIKIINGYDDKIKLDTYFLLNENILYLYNKTIIQPEPLKLIKYFFHAQGGLLCDNTGLGKTLTLSVHITDDTTKTTDIIASRVAMFSEYKTSLNSSQLEHIVNNKEDILNVLDTEYKMLNAEYKLKTNSNLLIVPVRLLQQWETEIKSYLPSSNVYLINTVRDFYKLKLEDIDKYSVIIISITFLQNDKRLAHPLGYDITNILWKRVIVDEVHELFSTDANSRRNFTMVNSIKALYKWGISATPPLQLNCDNMLQFITNNNYWINSSIDNHNNKYYHRVTTDVKDYIEFINTYYRYNEKTKVDTEISIPDHSINIVELEMSNIEKLMYNNAIGDTKRMIALCTNYKISTQDSSFSGFATVSELKNRMLDQHTKKKQEHVAKMEDEKKKIGYIKEIIDWLYTDRVSLPEHIKINYCIITGEYSAYNLTVQDHNLIADVIERVTKKLEINEKHIMNLEKELKLIEAKENMIDKFSTMIQEKLSEPCMICFGNLDSVMITTCNHMYCGICVNEMFKNSPNIKCPMCRTPLTRNDVNGIVDKNLNLISGDDMMKKIETKEEENVNITKGGTKIDAIIKYIKDTKDKIIIFATEKQTLELINEILIENNINFVNLKGNAYVVSKQLKKFKTGDVQVILLSADRANSGTNLIEASHIILLDTHLIPNIKQKEDVEKQAIGRAVRLGQKSNVKVVRFIMKNTIEQVYLNKIN